MSKQKVAVSACLLGETCRYDGTTKQVGGVVEAFKEDAVIAFCPEAPDLGTPRERISVVSTKEGLKVIGDESGRDVTELIEAQTQKLIDGHPDLEKIVLKSKSPSCGLGTTPILDEMGEIIRYGNGIAADMLLKVFAKIAVSDERSFE